MLPLSLAVVVITYRRPHHLDDNLKHLEAQTLQPDQVIVVDGSPDDLTRDIVMRHPIATYVRNPAGAGNMTSSRNAALAYVTADVIAFLDDDANAAADYVEQLTAFCVRRPEVMIGCGRALNGVRGEALAGVHEIGTLSPTGAMTGNFAADPGTDVAIAHGLGATMWIRRAAMDSLQGFREYFAGTSACEDTDLFLRARRLGFTAWFVHRAVATHVAAPQEGGQRFDRRYTYWSAHNSAILHMADAGLLTRAFARTTVATVARNLLYGAGLHRRAARTLIVAVAWMRGVIAAKRMFGRGPVNPIGGYRRDAPDGLVDDDRR